jgi:hypothetical protein
MLLHPLLTGVAHSCLRSLSMPDNQDASELNHLFQDGLKDGLKLRQVKVKNYFHSRIVE